MTRKGSSESKLEVLAHRVLSCIACGFNRQNGNHHVPPARDPAHNLLYLNDAGMEGATFSAIFSFYLSHRAGAMFTIETDGPLYELSMLEAIRVCRTWREVGIEVILGQRRRTASGDAANEELVAAFECFEEEFRKILRDREGLHQQ